MLSYTAQLILNGIERGLQQDRVSGTHVSPAEVRGALSGLRFFSLVTLVAAIATFLCVLVWLNTPALRASRRGRRQPLEVLTRTVFLVAIIASVVVSSQVSRRTRFDTSARAFVDVRGLKMTRSAIWAIAYMVLIVSLFARERARRDFATKRPLLPMPPASLPAAASAATAATA